ncbi:MAG: ABC transporter permease, partial [Pseudomonadota bacterium]
MTAKSALLRKPWIWAFAAALAVWLATAAFTKGQGSGEVLSVAFTFATFFVIVAIGQMFVVTLGPGNVDLSIPATMTLAGTVSMKVMDGANLMIVPGYGIAVGVGIGVGLFNYALIRLLRIPPIIATLSSSFVIQSAAIWYNRGLRIKPPEMLADFTTAKVVGMPVLALAVIVLAAVMHVVLNRTLYGRTVIAIGQNPRAARLAGLDVARVRFA